MTAVLLVATAATAGCDTKKILAVQDPDVALPATLESKAALPALRAGAVGDFGQAYSGPNNDFNQITLSGSLSDELINTETFPTRIEVDARRQNPENNGSLRGAFYAINRARASAERATAAFAKYDPTAKGYAESANLGGLSLVLLAENYCGSVPISRLTPDGKFAYGAGLTTFQLLDSAIARFDQAAQVATAQKDATQLNVAKVGKARALLDKDNANLPAAVAAVAGVPPEFQYLYNHSETTPSQNNGIWTVTSSVGRFGVADVKGTNGLPFQSRGDVSKSSLPSFDPRSPNMLRPPPSGPTGFDGATPQYVQLRYPLRSSASVIADGVEATLIVAEGLLASGNPQAAVDSLNSLRSNPKVLAARGITATLPPLMDAGLGLSGQAQTDARIDQVFAERAFWLYLTSHRLGDLRRLVRQYGRTNEGVFPTGTYFKGGNYGTDVNSPVPQAEDNNPSYTRASCKANIA